MTPPGEGRDRSSSRPRCWSARSRRGARPQPRSVRLWLIPAGALVLHIKQIEAVRVFAASRPDPRQLARFGPEWLRSDDRGHALVPCFATRAGDWRSRRSGGACPGQIPARQSPEGSAGLSRGPGRSGRCNSSALAASAAALSARLRWRSRARSRTSSGAGPSKSRARASGSPNPGSSGTSARRKACSASTRAGVRHGTVDRLPVVRFLPQARDPLMQDAAAPRRRSP